MITALEIEYVICVNHVTCQRPGDQIDIHSVHLQDGPRALLNGLGRIGVGMGEGETGPASRKVGEGLYLRVIFISLSSQIEGLCSRNSS